MSTTALIFAIMYNNFVVSGQTVIALVNGKSTIKNCYRKAGAVELHPANDTHPNHLIISR